MRILLTSWHRAVSGGAETYLRGLIPALVERGHDVALLHERQHAEADSSVDAGVTQRWCAAELGSRAAVAAVAAWRPDVAYNQGLTDPGLESDIVAGTPTVLFAHGYYGTCATGTKRYAFPRLQACTRTLGLPCLALNYGRRCGGLDPLTLVSTYRWQAARHDMLPKYRAVIVASQHMRREYARHGLADERLHVAPLPPADVVPDPNPPAGRPLSGRILFMGRLSDEKGVDYLIDAVPSAERDLGRPLSLVVAGAGPALERWRWRAIGRGVKAEFTGWVPASRKAELLRSADVVAVPSLWGEPYGLAGVEAGSVGVPAVGFAMGGIPEWLEPAETGELAPADPPTVGGLAAALVRALADPLHHQKLREGAWRHARLRTMDAHLATLMPILESAARG